MTWLLIETPQTRMTVIGAKLKPAGQLGYVWVCGPDGKPLLRCKRSQVSVTTPEATARRIVEERMKHA